MLKKISLYIYHIFFIHSSVDGHLGCFHILAILSYAAIKLEVHVSFLINVFIFSRYMPRSLYWRAYVSTILSEERIQVFYFLYLQCPVQWLAHTK